MGSLPASCQIFAAIHKASGKSEEGEAEEEIWSLIWCDAFNQGVALRCKICGSLLLSAQTYRQHIESKAGKECQSMQRISTLSLLLQSTTGVLRCVSSTAAPDAVHALHRSTRRI